MLIEFDLQGSKTRHRGIFDTTGFWARFEEEVREGKVKEDGTFEWIVEGYKIFSHFSFAFYHESEEIATAVYDGLILALSGADWEHPKIGFISEIC